MTDYGAKTIDTMERPIMGIFAERQRLFEEKFRHEQDLHFKITARRNRLAGDWAADLLGLSSKKADEYARSVVQAAFERAGEKGVLAKLRSDLLSNNIEITEAEIRFKLRRFANQAREQVMAE